MTDLEIFKSATSQAELVRLAFSRWQENKRIGTHSTSCHTWGISHYECAMRRITELEAQLAAVRMDDWIPVSERLPAIPTNCSREFIIACKRLHDGKTYVFAAEYLQELLLQSALPDDDEPEDGKPCTGWYQERNCESGDFDTEWQNIEADGSLITHWMPLPKPPIAGEQA